MPADEDPAPMWVKYVALAACLEVLGGCATTGSPDQVKELEGGVYSVTVPHSVTQGYDALGSAVEKAGEYCHAKGQTLSVMPGGSREVRFRCIPSYQPTQSGKAGPQAQQDNKQTD
jgi:hypothetical protein